MTGLMVFCCLRCSPACAGGLRPQVQGRRARGCGRDQPHPERAALAAAALHAHGAQRCSGGGVAAVAAAVRQVRAGVRVGGCMGHGAWSMEHMRCVLSVLRKPAILIQATHTHMAWRRVMNMPPASGPSSHCHTCGIHACMHAGGWATLWMRARPRPRPARAAPSPMAATAAT